MDKTLTVDIPRLPLVPAEENNAVSSRRSCTREDSSRYRSPTPSKAAGQGHCRSLGFAKNTPSPAQLVSERSQSAERKHPSMPQSYTPVQDSSVDMHLSSRRTSSRLPESLWPSTMRSLSVSFQSESISYVKMEKSINIASTDCILKPSSDAASQQVNKLATAQKPTPERKRSPLRGKYISDQSENSKPVDSLPTGLTEQHRWPSRMGVKGSSDVFSKNVDLADKKVRTSMTPALGMGQSSLRKVRSSDSIGKSLQKSTSGFAKSISLKGSRRFGLETKVADGNTLLKSDIDKFLSTVSPNGTSANTVMRTQSFSTIRSRPPSPSKTSIAATVSRGMSPSQTRPATPPPQWVSPSRIRTSNPPSQCNSLASVLSFLADFRKGGKGGSYNEDAHQLRLLHNTYLQWRFANTKAEAVLFIKEVTAERTLRDVWTTTLGSWNSVTRKKINLQQMKLDLALNSIVNEQMPYLNDWALLQKDHIISLFGAAEDLEASTLRLPATDGAKADIETLKAAICSAADMIQTMGSFINSLLSRVEAANNLVSKLAIIVAQERAMVAECKNLLASKAALQVEESSLRTHLVQMRRIKRREISHSVANLGIRNAFMPINKVKKKHKL